MRILLVAPPQSAAYGMRISPVYPPLGLLTLAAVLQQEGHAVRVMDADAEGLDIRAAGRWAFRWKAELIGLTATTPTFPEARRWAARLRASARCPVIIGGPHATALPREVLANECFDDVVCGEAETIIGRVVERLRGDHRIPGSGFETQVRTECSKSIPDEESLSLLPLPAWHLIRKPNRYRPPDARHLPVGTVMFSRGCPGGCKFCQSPALFGTRVRYLSPRRAVEHAWHVQRSIGAKEIHIIDDCFTADRAKALAILTALKEQGPPVVYAFGNGLRADMLDDEVLDAMAALPVHSFGLGIETADARIASDAGKRHHLAGISEVVDKARFRGIEVWGFFMLGLPGETAASLESTARLARDLPLDMVKFEVFKPYPGTPLFDQLKGQGAIRALPWSEWGIHTPPVHRHQHLGPRALWRARRRAIINLQLRPRSILRIAGTSRTMTRILLNLKAAAFVFHSLARMW